MNPQTEQGEPFDGPSLKSYKDDSNNFQMNMILARLST